MSNGESPLSVLDLEPDTATFLEDVISGLSADEKRLPCKYFYDRRGSKLFEQICQVDEYYLARSESEIMQHCAPQMAAQIGPGVMLIEYGSGASRKTRFLLDHLNDPAAYVPVDISRRHLLQSAEELASRYPQIQVLPVCADFTEEFALPVANRTPTHNAVYFPGSTIGNFEPQDAVDLLSHIARFCQTGGGLLIGIDLRKDVETLEAAYNDGQGVTAEFNLNLLHRINCELEADFNLDNFSHQAIYDHNHGRIEMRLVSRRDQVVSVDEHTFEFGEGESICTEHSHKYTVEEFSRIAGDVGFSLHRHWTDRQRKVAVLHLVVDD